MQVLMEVMFFFIEKGLFAFFCVQFVFNFRLPKEIKTMFHVPRRVPFWHTLKQKNYGLPKRCKETLRLSKYGTVFNMTGIYVYSKVLACLICN